MEKEIVVFWFRRDLRLEDNTGLQEALASGFPVLPVFIFDTDILNRLEDKADRRVDYIHQALQKIHEQLQTRHSGIKTYHGKPKEIFGQLKRDYIIRGVYCNRDYEPQAMERDEEIRRLLKTEGIAFHDYKDQVIFERSEITKKDEKPYTVYSPYAKKWRASLTEQDCAAQKTESSNFLKEEFASIHSLASLGFKKTDMVFKPGKLDRDVIARYDKSRNFPALPSTTQLGIALRFGTVSIRKCVAIALKHSPAWLAQLIWREFFMQILFHFPQVVNQCFKIKYEHVPWRNNEQEFELWCEGKTGYPIVDAGMRQLNQTGYMHNRVRMVAASFLCKHLLIDWRWGEAYFAAKLNDYDLASNNGNWQWAAGCGCDAAPYFRIFNPTTQAQKFDKESRYIRSWLSNQHLQNTHPIVDHKFARSRALAVYRTALKDVT